MDFICTCSSETFRYFVWNSIIIAFFDTNLYNFIFFLKIKACASDEISCTGSGKQPCIPLTWWCDDWPDCFGGVDELQCQGRCFCDDCVLETGLLVLSQKKNNNFAVLCLRARTIHRKYSVGRLWGNVKKCYRGLVRYLASPLPWWKMPFRWSEISIDEKCPSGGWKSALLKNVLLAVGN